jgi:acyl-CoA synthetase (AMP-forming)/AMP-acid ligase II
MLGLKFFGIASTGSLEWLKHLSSAFLRLLVSACFFEPKRGHTDTKSDAIPYFILLMSCLRANYVVFPISPRNSPGAVAHLIDKVGVRHLLIGHEPAMQDLANAALGILGKQYPLRTAPDVSHVPLFEELFLPASEQHMDIAAALPYEYKGPDATVVILHSSGSSRGFVFKSEH